MSSGKKILVGFILLLTIAIPASVYLVLQQQQTQSNAAPATTLSFDPPTLTKNVGDQFTINIHINTGENLVVGARIQIAYDTTKLDVISIDAPSDPFLPQVAQSGTVSNGFAYITMTSPNDPKKKEGTIAVVTLRAKAATGAAPAIVKFSTGGSDGIGTEISGIGEGGSNLLASTSNAQITINNPSSGTNPTPTTPAGPTATPTTIRTATPTTPVGGGGPLPTSTRSLTITPTSTTSARITLIPTLAPGSKGSTLSAQITTLPTVGAIPVTADVSPAIILSLAGGSLLLVGVALLFVL